jgi:hypothetical protein
MTCATFCNGLVIIADKSLKTFKESIAYNHSKDSL